MITAAAGFVCGCCARGAGPVFSCRVLVPTNKGVATLPPGPRGTTHSSTSVVCWLHPRRSG